MMNFVTIQQIIPKKKSNNFIIKFDNSQEILLNSDLIYKYGLSEKQKLSLQEKDKIIYDQNLMTAKKIAYDFVSYKPRTQNQVIKKLKEKDFSKEIIKEVINFLKDFKLLDDKNYARLFSKEIVNRKKIGKAKLKMELKKRGIDDEIINCVVDEIFQNINILELADLSAQKKLKTVNHKLPEKKKELLIQHLQRQGFEWNIIKKIIEKYQNNFV